MTVQWLTVPSCSLCSSIRIDLVQGLELSEERAHAVQQLGRVAEAKDESELGLAGAPNEAQEQALKALANPGTKAAAPPRPAPR